MTQQNNIGEIKYCPQCETISQTTCCCCGCGRCVTCGHQWCCHGNAIPIPIEYQNILTRRKNGRS